jgi:sulfoquinovosidase
MSQITQYVIKGREDIILDMSNLLIYVAQGVAKYRMKRGTFSTRDRIHNKIQLHFHERRDDIFIYTNEAISLEIKLSQNHDQIKMDFTCNKPMNRFWISLPSTNNEHIYGCGEQFTHLDLKTKKVRIWVSEHHSLKKILKKYLFEKIFGLHPAHLSSYREHQTYHAQPTFMSSKGYVVHADCDAYALFHFKKNETKLHFRAIPKNLTILYDQKIDRLAMKISHLVGRQQTLPTWASDGAIIASQGGLEQALKKIETAQSNDIKVVAIWCQDWSGQLKTAFGTQVYWNWQVDDDLYPKLKEAIKKMNQENIHFLGYINTFLKEQSPLWIEAKNSGFLILNQKSEPYSIQSTTFNAGIVDLTNPIAYDWYKEIIKKNMIEIGMSGWMADFGEYLPTDAIIYAGDAESHHNIWPDLWANLNREAIEESGFQNKLFFFNRAGHTKTIKSSNSIWAGDQHVDFSDAYGLPSVITATLSMATIGVGHMHSDIGGYTTILHMKRSPELFMRWAEMNVFTPLFRCHEGNKPEANCQFDHNKEVLSHFAKMSKLFVLLKPYREATVESYQKEGIAINRPLFFHFDEDFAWLEKRTFMFGPDLIVAPIYRQNQMKREVHLPKGTWIHLLTKEVYHGGQHIVEVPFGLPAAFYHKDSHYATLFESITL